MPYGRDYTAEIDIDDGNGCITAPATFSTRFNHPDDLPSLTLETVTLGQLHLSRSQLCDWLGNEHIKRIEAASVPETWERDVPDSWNYDEDAQ